MGFIYFVSFLNGDGNSICDYPIKYSLGDVDQRFGITKEELAGVADKSEKVWEVASNLELFTYDENATFKVNLVFTEIQANTEKVKEVESLDSQYTNLEREYNSKLSSYNTRSFSYDVDVGYWNSVGGAPSDEYYRLEREKNILEQMQIEVNSLVEKLNNLAEKINLAVKDLDEWGGEFDQGEYYGDGINIYQFYSRSDLKLVLAHELGHALDLNHVEGSSSIMYYLMEDQDLNNLHLTDQDWQELRSVCNL